LIFERSTLARFCGPGNLACVHHSDDCISERLDSHLIIYLVVGKISDELDHVESGLILPMYDYRLMPVCLNETISSLSVKAT
jgi:hypothetical protein